MVLSHSGVERVPISPGNADQERELLERIRTGDESAFEDLFYSYYAPLCGFVQSYVRSADGAEDVVQSVFLRIWERRETWDPANGMRAYLFSACRNRALDHIKHTGIVERAAETMTSTASPAGTGRAPARPDEELQRTELAEAFRHVVHAMPERRRLVFVLRWEHGMSHAEIGRVLGISAKGAETQFARALASLRETLGRFRP